MFQNIWNAIKTNAAHFASVVWGDVKSAAAATEEAAVADFDALIEKYKPAAIALATQAEQGVVGIVTGSEKASYVKTQLSETLQADGHSVAADGYGAFLNLLTEFGANFVKVLAGGQLKAPSAS